MQRWATNFAAGTAAILLAPGPAVAASPDRAACLDAYVQAQDARKAGTLLTARNKLEICVDSTCPGMVQRDCAQWLEEVTRALPSIVIVVRDDAGKDLLDATATVDEAPIRLDGHVVPLDPGKHTVRVRTREGETKEEPILLAEGERGRQVTFRFASRTAPVPTPTPAPAPSLFSPSAAPDAPPQAARSVPLPSWLMGGLGVVSLGIFSGFAIKGASDRSSFGCDRACSSAKYSTVNGEFLVADIALGAAVALVGAAVVYWLVDSGRAPSAGTVKVGAR